MKLAKFASAEDTTSLKDTMADIEMALFGFKKVDGDLATQLAAGKRATARDDEAEAEGEPPSKKQHTDDAAMIAVPENDAGE